MSERSLRPKIREWLEKQGYPLEMRVAAALQQKNLLLRQGWYYHDTETNTFREIDIIASRLEPIGLGEVQFAIECKSSSHPWVLLTSRDTATNFDVLTAFAILSGNARACLIDRLFPLADIMQTASEQASVPWLEKAGRRGYSLCRALSGGEDTAYKACLSAMKAAAWLSTNSVQKGRSDGDFSAVFPVVVTSGPLFECYLSDEGDIEVEPIDSGFLFFPRETRDTSPTYIAVVSEAGLEQFASEAEAIATRLLELWKDNIDAQFKRRRRGP